MDLEAEPRRRDSAAANVLSSVGGAVGAGLLAAAKVFALHTILVGLLVGVIVYWTTSGAGFWNGVAATSGALVIHAGATVFVVFWSTLIAAGAAVKRLGVARSVLRAAVAQAEAINPKIRESNDFGAISSAIAASFDSLAKEEMQTPAGLFARVGGLAKRISRRIILVVGRVVLRELELMPRTDGTVAYGTIDEWLGARVDGYAAQAVSRPGVKWVSIVLVIQLMGTLGMVLVAR